MGHEVILGLYIASNTFSGSPTVTAINTASTGYNLVSLDLQTPTVSPVDGRVTETMVVNVHGTSLADLRTKLASIFDFADQVRRFEQGQNAMYGLISMQPGDSGNTYYSMLHAVDVSLPRSMMGVDFATWDVDVTIVYERDGWWTKPISNGFITLTNPNGTATNLNIYNCNDMTGSSPNKLANYIDIDTTDVKGDLPVLVCFNIDNKMNVASGNKRIYIGGIGASGSTYIPNLFHEAESASGGTTTADVSCSGGNKKKISITTSAETNALKWTIAKPFVQLYQGAWFKLIARFADVGSLGNVKFRWKLLSGPAAIWEGPQFIVENNTDLIQEMGEIPLPPVNKWIGDIDILLTVQRITSATETLNLDYIQLMASQCAIKLVGKNPQEYDQNLHVPLNEAFPFMSIYRGVDYADWSAQWAKAIYINPGQYYRLHFVVQTETGVTAEINRLSTVEVIPNPRYRGIGE